jgi:hypothetical protein
MIVETVGTVQQTEKRSYFAKKLASDPALAARCEAVVSELRNAANEDLKAVERSEQLTSEDFAIYINARADSTVPETE